VTGREAPEAVASGAQGRVGAREAGTGHAVAEPHGAVRQSTSVARGMSTVASAVSACGVPAGCVGASVARWRPATAEAR
jgi:hypothetical protein